ncbi:MAG: hypothetical protein ABI838_03485, partial [Chloroflexota bacterium]
PGVLILQSLVELASAQLARARAGQFRLAGMEGVRFRRFVEPGEVLRLEIDQIAVPAPGESRCRGRALVAGQLAATVRTLRMVAGDQP